MLLCAAHIAYLTKDSSTGNSRVAPEFKVSSDEHHTGSCTLHLLCARECVVKSPDRLQVLTGPITDHIAFLSFSPVPS